MRAIIVIALTLSVAACRTSNLGSCSSEVPCPGGATCDLTRGVCVIPAGACFPACDATHVCDTGSLTCVPATTASISITAPLADAVVAGTLQASATAHAPGGVTAVTFELRSTGGSLLSSANGAQSSTDATSWTAAISLATVPDGPATLTAIATWSQGTVASQAVGVTVHQNACFPSCPSGQVCQGGACVTASCNPACDAAHQCNNGVCDPVTAASIAITSPASGVYVAGTLQATATAHAPGGVTSVRFDLSSGATVVATAQGAAAGPDPSNFAGSIPLAGISDGAASLVATVIYPGGSASSSPVPVVVDQNPPAIAMSTDGRTSFFAPGQTATIGATIGDGSGSGVVDSTVALTIAGRPSVAGTPGAPGAYTFPIPIDSTYGSAGASTTLAFQIAAKDRAGLAGSLAGDPKEVLQIDRDAPQIASITYTPAGFTDNSGHLLLGGPAGGNVSVQATITDGAGVAPASVCLRANGSCVASSHSGNVWNFTLPRPAAPQDGTAAFNFTLEADDTLAASLTGASQAEHQTRSAQVVYFDYVGPTITVAADATPYARTSVPIPVGATITDPAGVPDGGVFLNGSLAPASRDGGFFLFQLDPLSAPAGVEGQYNFQISAVNNISNAADAGASRVIDDAAPAASVRVFKGSTDPGPGTGVTYPAAVANTGWTGDSFIYTDTVHVKGTLADVSGLGSATLHVDGTDINGAAVTGSQTSLGCVAAATSCSFDVQVALNVAQPQFNTGAGDAGLGGTLIPSGVLTLTIDAADQAKSADNNAAPHAASTKSLARATRLLWQQAITTGNVTGMAVHPSGDLIVTGDSITGASVYDLAPDQPSIRWSTGSSNANSSPDSGVPAAPAIGAGDASTAPIYVASAIGNIYSFAPDGGVLWASATSASFYGVSPAIDNAAWTDGGTVEQILEPDNDTATKRLWGASAGVNNPAHSSTMSNVDPDSAPIVLGSAVWFGTTGSATTGIIESHPLNNDGSLGARATIGGLQARPYFGVITDGTSIFAATNRNSTRTSALDMYSINPADGGTNWDATGAHLTAEPTIAIDGFLYASRFVPVVMPPNPNTTVTINAADGGIGTTPLDSLSATTNGLTPLHGSEGHWYLPSTPGHLDALVNAGTPPVAKQSWSFDSGGTILSQTIIDCGGRLFVASGSSVYAFVSDDRGLAPTAWPSLRRDSRNTGNANAPQYGMRLVDNSCTQ